MKTILLVEEDETLSQFFSRVFNNAGYVVYCLSSFEEIASMNQKSFLSSNVMVVNNCLYPQQIRQWLSSCNFFNPIVGLYYSDDISVEQAQHYFDYVVFKNNFLLTDFIELLKNILEGNVNVIKNNP